MINDFVTEPIKRSRLRRKLGRKYYTLKRRLQWLMMAGKYAKTLQSEPLPFVIKEHQSFLLRPLKDVDMQLQRNKVTNLKIAISHLNGLLIKPGEVFSLWYLVGNPTAARGYLPGLVLNQGQIESGVGGGLCQLGNLLFWMAIHSPLTIKERYRHGFDVFPDVNRKVPFGAGATLAYNYIDLQLANDTNVAYQLELYLSEEYLHGLIRSSEEPDQHFEIFEDNHRIVHQPWGGYTRHNQICRKHFDGDKQLIKEEVLLENHAVMMYEPFLEESIS